MEVCLLAWPNEFYGPYIFLLDSISISMSPLIPFQWTVMELATLTQVIIKSPHISDKRNPLMQWLTDSPANYWHF